MSFKSFIASIFLGTEIAKLEAAFEAIESKIETVATAEATKIKAEVGVEVASAKAVFAKLGGKAKAEIAKLEAFIGDLDGLKGWLAKIGRANDFLNGQHLLLLFTFYERRLKVQAGRYL